MPNFLVWQSQLPTWQSQVLGIESKRHMAMPPVGARADAEFRAEGAVESRQIAEAAVQRDLQNFRSFDRQAHRRRAQARSPNVLVWSDARHPLKSAEKMIWTETRLFRQAAESQPGIGMVFDPPHDSRHSCQGAAGWVARAWGELAHELHRPHGHLHA